MGRNDSGLWCHCKETHWLKIHLEPFRAPSMSSAIPEIQISCTHTFSVFQATAQFSYLTCEYWIALSTLPPSTPNPFVGQSYDWAAKEIRSHYKLLASVYQIELCRGVFQMASLLSYHYRMFESINLENL